VINPEGDKKLHCALLSVETRAIIAQLRIRTYKRTAVG